MRWHGLAASLVAVVALVGPLAGRASAQAAAADPGAPPASVRAPAAPTDPSAPAVPTATVPANAERGAPDASINLDLGNATKKPSTSITIILLLTLLSVAPSLLMMLTSFTRVVIVLSLTRNALGLQSIPPNQVVAGLALFLSLFIMSPTLSAMNHDALQPYLKGTITQSQAYDKATAPLKTFMLRQTRKPELALFVKAADKPQPKTPADTDMSTLVPAFILSEIKTAFIIGFVIFIPFLVIDLIVSSSLMSMGMMMLPPVLVSLPFKILLFVMVDGWALVVRSLLTSFR